MAAPWERERNCRELEPPRIQKGRWQMLPSYSFLLMGCWGHQGRGYFAHPAFQLNPFPFSPYPPVTDVIQGAVVSILSQLWNILFGFFPLVLSHTYYFKNTFKSHRNTLFLLWNSSVWHTRKPALAAWNISPPPLLFLDIVYTNNYFIIFQKKITREFNCCYNLLLNLMYVIVPLYRTTVSFIGDYRVAAGWLTHWFNHLSVDECLHFSCFFSFLVQ